MRGTLALMIAFNVTLLMAACSMTDEGVPTSPDGQPEAHYRGGSGAKAEDQSKRTIEIEVLMPDGTSPKFATIWTHPVTVPNSVNTSPTLPHSENFEYAMGWRATTNRLTLTKGSYYIEARVDWNFELLRRNPVLVNVGEGGPREVVIQMQVVPSIRVAVTSENGLVSWRQTILRCVPWEGDEPPTLEAIDALRIKRSMPAMYREEAVAVHGQESRLWDPLPGKHVIVAIRNKVMVGYAFSDGRDLTVPVQLTIAKSERSQYAVVWVKGPDGTLITEGCTFCFREVRGPARYLMGQVQSAAQADGSYHVECLTDWIQSFEGPGFGEWNPEPTGLGVGKRLCWYTISHARFGSLAWQFTATSETELSVQFKAPSTLDVRVVGSADPELTSRLSVIVQPWLYPVNDWFLLPGTEKAVNDAKFEGLQPGSVTVTLIWRGEGKSFLVMSEVLKEIDSASNSMEIILPALFTLRVNHPSGEPSALLHVLRHENSQYPRWWFDPALNRQAWRTISPVEIVSLSTGADRSATFVNLPAGTYTVCRSHEDGSPRKVRTFVLSEDMEFSLPRS